MVLRELETANENASAPSHLLPPALAVEVVAVVAVLHSSPRPTPVVPLDGDVRLHPYAHLLDRRYAVHGARGVE